MKTWLLALMILPSFAFAATHETVVKVADGTIAKCENAADAFEHKRGAYRLAVKDTALKADWLMLDIAIEFLACQQTEQGWGFVAVPAHASLNYKIDEQEITIHTRDVFVTLTRADQLVSSFSWEPGAFSKIYLGVNEVLSEEEQQKLMIGEEVEGAVDITLVKDLMFTGKEGFVSGERASFGAFRHHFKLKL